MYQIKYHKLVMTMNTLAAVREYKPTIISHTSLCKYIVIIDHLASLNLTIQHNQNTKESIHKPSISNPFKQFAATSMLLPQRQSHAHTIMLFTHPCTPTVLQQTSFVD